MAKRLIGSIASLRSSRLAQFENAASALSGIRWQHRHWPLRSGYVVDVVDPRHGRITREATAMEVQALRDLASVTGSPTYLLGGNASSGVLDTLGVYNDCDIDLERPEKVNWVKAQLCRIREGNLFPIDQDQWEEAFDAPTGDGLWAAYRAVAFLVHCCR